MSLYALSIGWFLVAPRRWFPEGEVSAEATSAGS
jgi:hypothetical protein